MKNIFLKETTEELIERLSHLTEDTQPAWGSMDAAKMLAHCNVTYEMVFEDKHPVAKGFKRFMLKKFVKPIVVGAKPYKKNSPTAPAFLIKSEKNFQEEKGRLENYLRKTQSVGKEAFEGKESNSFGNLSADEWNTMFYKHLDYHFTQFGI
jgi:hypothetical protein